MSCKLVSFWFWSCKIAKVLRQCWGFVDVTWVGGLTTEILFRTEKIQKISKAVYESYPGVVYASHPFLPHNCSNTAKVPFALFHSFPMTQDCWYTTIAGGIPHISGDFQPSLKTRSQDTWTTESRCGSCQGEQHLLGHLGQKILGDKLKYRDNMVKANPLRIDFELRLLESVVPPEVVGQQDDVILIDFLCTRIQVFFGHWRLRDIQHQTASNPWCASLLHCCFSHLVSGTLLLPKWQFVWAVLVGNLCIHGIYLGCVRIVHQRSSMTFIFQKLFVDLVVSFQGELFMVAHCSTSALFSIHSSCFVRWFFRPLSSRPDDWETSYERILPNKVEQTSGASIQQQRDSVIFIGVHPVFQMKLLNFWNIYRFINMLG